jgi:hypothetical protein
VTAERKARGNVTLVPGGWSSWRACRRQSKTARGLTFWAWAQGRWNRIPPGAPFGWGTSRGLPGSIGQFGMARASGMPFRFGWLARGRGRFISQPCECRGRGGGDRGCGRTAGGHSRHYGSRRLRRRNPPGGFCRRLGGCRRTTCICLPCGSPRSAGCTFSSRSHSRRMWQMRMQ